MDDLAPELQFDDDISTEERQKTIDFLNSEQEFYDEINGLYDYMNQN